MTTIENNSEGVINKLRNIANYTDVLYKIDNEDTKEKIDPFESLHELSSNSNLEYLNNPTVVNKNNLGFPKELKASSSIYYNNNLSETVCLIDIPKNKIMTELLWFTGDLVQNVDFYINVIQDWKIQNRFVYASYSGFSTHHNSFHVPFINKNDTEIISLHFKTKRKLSNLRIMCLGYDFQIDEDKCYCFAYDSKHLFDRSKTEYMWAVLKLLEIPFYTDIPDSRLKVPNNVILFH